MSDQPAPCRFSWSDASIEWYENAVEYTGYNRILWRFLAPYFAAPGDTVCELACGTGSLAGTIAPHVKQYTANDIDPVALSFLKKKMRKTASLEKIKIIEGDWHHALSGFRFDTVLFQQFSAFQSDWERLSQLAVKQVIGILPSQKDAFHGPERESDCALAETELPVTATKPLRETWQDAVALLESKGVSHEIISFEVDFGQPFSSLEEAFSYYRFYYDQHLSDAELNELTKNQLKKTPTGFYLPKQKKLGIVIARL